MNLANARVMQVLIPVDDFEKGVAFYKDTLGLQFLFAAPPQMAFFLAGSVRILVAGPLPGVPVQRGSAIYFGVTDIEAVHATLRAAGVTFRAEPHLVHRTPEMELWLAEFTDPDGNALALMEEKR